MGHVEHPSVSLHCRRLSSSTVGAVKRTTSGPEVLIFDRFIYDELANLPLRNSMVQAYVRAMATFGPRPDVSFLLDADPATARARKPEYPLEFLQFNRKSYLALNDLIGGFTVVAPAPIHEVEQKVRALVDKALSNPPPPGKRVKNEANVAEQQRFGKACRSHPESVTFRMNAARSRGSRKFWN